jgi:hypothetical protein
MRLGRFLTANLPQCPAVPVADAVLRLIQVRIADWLAYAIRQCQHSKGFNAPIQAAGGVSAVLFDVFAFKRDRRPSAADQSTRSPYAGGYYGPGHRD